MQVVGWAATVVIGLVVVGAVVIGAVSVPDIRRYLRIRRM
ncbi:DUF6893 family small protein [Mycobacterium avium]|nr:hypothetical protein CKJ73_24620 [Mycobacterium avium]